MQICRSLPPLPFVDITPRRLSPLPVYVPFPEGADRRGARSVDGRRPNAAVSDVGKQSRNCVPKRPSDGRLIPQAETPFRRSPLRCWGVG